MGNSILYRYFFFDWLFKDAGKGTLFERAAALRYNQTQAKWLWVYLLRWTVLSVSFFGLGTGLELLDLIHLAAWFFTGSVLAAQVDTIIIVAMLGFKYLV